MRQSTTRQKIEQLLRSRNKIQPTSISRELTTRDFHISPFEVVEQIKELKYSFDGTIYVQAPKCNSCGFDRFDKKLNIPSKCPKCNSTWIEEPWLIAQ